MKYLVEYTDLFCGDANYSWARRATIDAPDNATDAGLIRKAKQALGIKERHVKRSHHGDDVEIRFGTSRVLFISPEI